MLTSMWKLTLFKPNLIIYVVCFYLLISVFLQVHLHVFGCLCVSVKSEKCKFMVNIYFTHQWLSIALCLCCYHSFAHLFATSSSWSFVVLWLWVSFDFNALSFHLQLGGKCHSPISSIQEGDIRSNTKVWRCYWFLWYINFSPNFVLLLFTLSYYIASYRIFQYRMVATSMVKVICFHFWCSFWSLFGRSIVFNFCTVQLFMLLKV